MKSYNVTGVLGVVAGVRWLLVWFRVYSEDPIRYLDEGKKKESDGYWSGFEFILEIQYDTWMRERRRNQMVTGLVPSLF